MRESVKIVGAVVIVALLAAVLGTLAVHMLDEATRAKTPLPTGSQEERNTEARKAETAYGNEEGKRNPDVPYNRSTSNKASHPQAAQGVDESRTSHSQSDPNGQSIFGPWQPSFNAILVITASLQVVIGFLTVRVYLDQAATLRRQAEGLEAANKVAGASADAAKLAADAALEANRLSRDAYIADQRPWVSVKVDPGRITWEMGACHIMLVFRLKNVGRTPALQITVNPQARAPRGDFNPAQEQHALSDIIRNVDKVGSSFTVFPGDVGIIEAGVTILPGEVASWARTRPAGEMPIRDYIEPWVYGCVQYWSDVDKAFHQTGYIFQVERIFQPRG